jgi:DNA-binding response OmpR family regulator
MLGYAEPDTLGEVALKHRVLIVDDDTPTREALARGLTSAGYEVVAACEFEEGAALLDLRSFALAILDLSLTSLNRLEGVELVEAARYRWPQLPIVVYTGNDEPGVRAECLRRGASAFVAKPVSLAELRSVIDTLLAPLPGPA